jgi:hypothetical protein
MGAFVTKLRYIDDEEDLVDESVAWWSWSILEVETGHQMTRDVQGLAEARSQLASNLARLETTTEEKTK